MAKVYLVTHGEYSDYKVLAIFSTEAKAQAFIDRFCGDIEEWEVDEADPLLNSKHDLYYIRMAADGRVMQVGRMEDEFRQDGLHPSQWGDSLAGHLWAKNEEHAIKQANDYRAAMLADGRIRHAGDERRDGSAD